MNKRKNIVYIMSGSISNWFSYFCDSENLIEVIFGNSEMKEDILKEIERVENTYGKTVNIYIISSHISLKSDIDLVRRFRERGYKVFVNNNGKKSAILLYAKKNVETCIEYFVCDII